MEDLKVGDTLQAKDQSCTFVVEKLDIVGVWGTVIRPDGSTAEGAVTWAQLDTDFTKE